MLGGEDRAPVAVGGPCRESGVLAEPTVAVPTAAPGVGGALVLAQGTAQASAHPLMPSTAVPGRPVRGDQGKDPTLSSASGAGA